jgi:hypothetical protein
MAGWKKFEFFEALFYDFYLAANLPVIKAQRQFLLLKNLVFKGGPVTFALPKTKG